MCLCPQLIHSKKASSTGALVLVPVWLWVEQLSELQTCSASTCLKQ